jgi:PKD repeat protein
VIRRISLPLLASLFVVTGLVVPEAAGAPSDTYWPSGHADFAYGSAVSSSGGQGTAYKPESKLFFTGDGTHEPIRWWGVFGVSGSPNLAQGLYLWELVDHIWQPTFQFTGADPWGKADTLLDGSTLYVSVRDNKKGTSANPQQALLYKVPYLGNGVWGTVPAPTVMTTSAPEAMTIAMDSVGRIWTAFRSGTTVKVGNTAPGGTTFTFSTLSVPSLSTDDVAAITAFGSRIGVMWSDQNTKRDYFAWRSDAEALGTWHVETAWGGGVNGCPTSTSDLCADDHINLKVYGDQVYAVIKTSLNDPATPNPSDPVVVVLRRDAAGTWTSYVVSDVKTGGSRPVLLLSPETDEMYVFARRHAKGVNIWQSSLSSPGFATSAYRTWTSSGSNTIDDATSTKQVITANSGVIVASSNATTGEYWHNEILPAPAPEPDQPPIASLSATPSSGPAPLTVVADASGSTDVDATPIRDYTFDFGDGTVVGPQASPTATHLFVDPGTYIVSVTVSDIADLSATRSAMVNVGPSAPDAPPVPALSVSPDSGPAPLTVVADASGSTDVDATPIRDYTFDFGDGTVVGPQVSPTASHTYTAAGTRTVTVTVADTAGRTASTGASVTVLTNLVGNGTFEASVSGWNNGFYDGVTLTRSSVAHSGSSSVMVANTGSTATQCTLNDSPNWIATSSAGNYTASLWARADVVGATLKLRLREQAKTGGTTLQTRSVSTPLTTNWQRISLALTPSSPGSTTIDLTAYQSNAPSGTCFYVDDVGIVKT